ncbi:MAG: Fic family protein, partial [Deltaproteobacteria bacterium]|nr:Fic family protein [Deltaproteobacteria bacterium]
GNALPADRPEEEIVGYRRALAWIHQKYEEISITPDTFLRLHALAQGGASGDAGHWKKRDNEIIEILPNGERRIRFVPVSAAETLKAVEQLCLGYQHAIQEDLLPPLLAVGALIFDFLCVHPFRDGNGRVSRLLTLLALYQQGFEVGRYVSLERLVEEEKETYYDVLARSSAHWHNATHDLVPWWNHFLSTLRQAYISLSERLEIVSSGPGKSELVRQAILHQAPTFTLREILTACPSVSPQLARKVLSQQRADGCLTLTGRGRGARWHRS